MRMFDLNLNTTDEAYDVHMNLLGTASSIAATAHIKHLDLVEVRIQATHASTPRVTWGTNRGDATVEDAAWMEGALGLAVKYAEVLEKQITTWRKLNHVADFVAEMTSHAVGFEAQEVDEG